MKKIYTGVAIAALAASPAFANKTEVSLYGLGHVSADNVDDGEDSSIYFASNSSRLGLKGTHAIDESTSVVFQFESGLDPTAQGTNDGNGGAESEGQIFTKGRPSYIGLKGKFGTVLMGHMPALDQWANDFNLFADKVGDLGNLWEGSGIPGRMDNVTYYETPDFSGINLAFTYSPEEGEEDGSDIIIKGSYAVDALKVGVALANIGQGPTADEEHEALAVVVQYDFGQFTVGGGFQSESNIGGTSGNDRDSTYAAAKFKLSEQGSISVQYALSSGDADDSDASQFAIGYDHILDDHLTVYAAYAMMKNDDNVQFSVNGKGHGDRVEPALGEDPSALSLGIIYSFDGVVFNQ
ncbi:MAG: porin [Agarilytica sp.]